ncbi:hypothetical protein [Nocardia sp. NPDC051463]|uniref:hypothetical protein n=1 Tax=Nocardia sp. NPDC051463 TaxID=3154845 RepID=UPI00344BDB9B
MGNTSGKAGTSFMLTHFTRRKIQKSTSRHSTMTERENGIVDIEEAVRGARLLAADIESSLGMRTRVETEYPDDWQEFHEEIGRSTPNAWVSVAVPDAGTSAALDPSESVSTSAEGFAMELARILQDDIQIHLREPWPEDRTRTGSSLAPSEAGWRSLGEQSYTVPYGQLK